MGTQHTIPRSVERQTAESSRAVHCGAGRCAFVLSFAADRCVKYRPSNERHAGITTADAARRGSGTPNELWSTSVPSHRFPRGARESGHVGTNLQSQQLGSFIQGSVFLVMDYYLVLVFFQPYEVQLILEACITNCTF